MAALPKTRRAEQALRVFVTSSVLGTLALLVSLLALAPAALAGPPAHPHLPGLTLFGTAPDPGPAHPPQPFDRACGAAVDSEGDVYVASAGNEAIDVFGPAHEYLTRIANTNEPCGLAVNFKGELFVSETATGKVVRYKPNAYPFAGTPSYGLREEIDVSGEAAGIAVDPFDDRLYVARGSRIDVYDPNGKLGLDEVQRVRISPFATGGTFTLSYGSTAPTTTAPIAYDAPSTGPGSVQERLEELGEIEPGDIVVTEVRPQTHDVGFIGSLARTDLASLVADPSGLEGEKHVEVSEQTKGFSGHIEGDLSDATGIAPYTYEPRPGDPKPTRYLAVADAASDEVKLFSGPDVRTLELRRTITGVDHDDNPATAEQKFGFGEEGAYLASDPGYCPTEAQDPQPKQACTAGHFLLYDAANEVVDEFEATGEFLLQVPSPEPPFSFDDAEPSAIAIDRSGGPEDGTSYVTAGAGPGAKALAFARLSPPSRLGLPGLSFGLQNACGAAVDKGGNRYFAANTAISVYPPTGDVPPTQPLVTIGADSPCDLAVDEECNLYALDQHGSNEGDEEVLLYEPSACPPEPGTTYGAPRTVADNSDFPSPSLELRSIAVNARSGHLFVGQLQHTIKLDAAKEGSALLDPCFACGVGVDGEDIAVHGASGNVYLSRTGVFVVDEDGEEVLGQISGAGSRKGPLGRDLTIGVDQSNGHVIVFDRDREVVEEYEASGTFVAQFGSFSNAARRRQIAIDNSGGPNEGNVYLSYLEDVSAFAPLSYAEAPIVAADTPSEVGGGEATLNGTVDPRGFEVEECRFDYTTDADFQANGFAGALTQQAPCIPGPEGIGTGTGPVAVHAELTGLGPDQRYRFRLVAVNEHGEDEEAGLFGPPLLSIRSANPTSYTEATLRARVDPSGLPTTYRFEYGTSTAYGQSTAEVSLAASAGPTEVEVPIFGLEEGTTYHFRAVAVNDVKEALGPDQSLLTLTRSQRPSCPNEEYRTGPSAGLPDCRAYELVTPADTRGMLPNQGLVGRKSNDWLITPRGEAAGQRLSFFLEGTLPGFDGGGLRDGYRAERAEGPHPAAGWRTELTAPSYLRGGGSQPEPRGVASDQLYSFWEIDPIEAFEGTVAEGLYLRTPSGFEPAVRGTLGSDLGTTGTTGEGRFISPGGEHVIFFSKEHLEPTAPPAGTTTIYDRAAGETSARVVSRRPDGSPFAAGEHATYIGTSEDASTVAFEVAGRLYARLDNTETVGAPDSFPGDTLTCTGAPVSATATLSYQWLSGGAPIAGATGATYVPTAADAGALLQCRVRAASEEGASAATGAALILAPFPTTIPPHPVSGPAIAGNPTVGQTLTCAPGAWRGDPTFAYQWHRDGEPIAAQTNPSYQLAAADQEAVVQCAVTATNAGGALVSFSARAYVHQAGQPPTQTAAPAISGTAAVGQTLTCTPGAWQGAPGFGFGWLRNGAAIPAANSNTYTVVAAGEGKALQCRVRATTPDAVAEATSAARVIAPAPATAPPAPGSAVAISGAAAVGQTLTCEPGAWAGEPTLAYRWLRNGAPIGAATAPTYTLAPADRETTVQCEVSATNPGGTVVALNGAQGARYVEPNPPVASAAVPNGMVFAGLSTDGSRLFYTNAADGQAPGKLFALDLESEEPTAIAEDAVFLNVSPDGSHVYFTSTEVLDLAQEGVQGDPNLYLWDGSEIRFIAGLDPKDVVGGLNIDLARWSDAVGPIQQSTLGRGLSPTRSTPSGEVLVFESHARLTPYDNQGLAQVYRYDANAESTTCVSCDPSGAPPSGEAVLQDLSSEGISVQTLIPNVTDDGRAVFFASEDALLPEDANAVADVYQWKAPGSGEAGSCDLPEGCLALISTGQGERDSFLYSMTPDGRDVFFTTFERLHGQDVSGSASIYDARIGGGIPDPPAPEACQGDACQGQGTTPPALAAPQSSPGAGRNVAQPRRARPCPKGKRKVRSKNGKARCVKRRGAKRRGHQRTQNKRRATR